MDDGTRKFTTIGISVVLLMTAVIGAVGSLTIHTKSNDTEQDVTTSNKAVDSLCQYTDYKIECRKSLAGAKATDDVKKLVKIAFNSAINEIEHAINRSSAYLAEAKDPRAAEALNMCKEFLNISINDLKRSLKKLNKRYLEDIEVWLSGSLTFQDTCHEGFKSTAGDFGKKMMKVLELSWKLTSNVLAMVVSVGEHLGDVGLNNEYAWWLSNDQRLVLDTHRRKLNYNAIVAHDGSGQFWNIMDAVRTVPLKSTKPFVIFIKQGVYYEYVSIPTDVTNVVLIGEGPTKTIITGNRNYKEGDATYLTATVGKHSTYKTATVAVNGNGFMAKDIRIENTAGPTKHQAVALRISGDRAIIHHCIIDGYQDTLYAHTYRQFYSQCTITGTVDFIFGNAAAVFQDCKMIVKKPVNSECVVTAQGRKERYSKGGLILQNCTITGNREYMATKPRPRTYLGRPWKLYSRTIIMQSFIDGIIEPEGWKPWAGTFGLDTCYYGEFRNRGPGSNTARRVTWKGIKKISPEEADGYTPRKYIQGDLWIKATGVPYSSGMMNV